MVSVRISILYKALIPSLMLAASVPAHAGDPSWVSPSKKTVFDQVYSIGCGPEPKIIKYTTESNNTKYQGTFWVKQFRGCSGPGKLNLDGYFEDSSVAVAGSTRKEWCKGSLKLALSKNDVGGTGVATWSAIKSAKQGYSCNATGKTFSVPLNFSL